MYLRSVNIFFKVESVETLGKKKKREEEEEEVAASKHFNWCHKRKEEEGEEKEGRGEGGIFVPVIVLLQPTRIKMLHCVSRIPSS